MYCTAQSMGPVGWSLTSTKNRRLGCKPVPRFVLLQNICSPIQLRCLGSLACLTSIRNVPQANSSSHISRLPSGETQPMIPGEGKMPKTRRSAVREICQETSRFTVKEKWKNAQVSISAKMPKTRRSVVTENCKNSQVRSHGECQKFAGLRSRKNAKNLQVRGHRKCQKLVGLQWGKNAKNSHVHCDRKWQTLAGPASRKNMQKTFRSAVKEKPKICRSAFKENAKNLQVRCHAKCRKLTGMRSWKNAKNSQVRGQRNMPRNLQVCNQRKMKTMHSAAFLWKFQKLTGPRSRKYANKLPGRQSQKMQNMHRSAFMQNGKNSHVRSHGKMLKTCRSPVTTCAEKSQVRDNGKMRKTHRSAVKEKCQKLAGPRSEKYAKKFLGLKWKKNENNA